MIIKLFFKLLNIDIKYDIKYAISVYKYNFESVEFFIL